MSTEPTLYDVSIDERDELNKPQLIEIQTEGINYGALKLFQICITVPYTSDDIKRSDPLYCFPD